MSVTFDTEFQQIERAIRAATRGDRTLLVRGDRTTGTVMVFSNPSRPVYEMRALKQVVERALGRAGIRAIVGEDYNNASNTRLVITTHP